MYFHYLKRRKGFSLDHVCSHDALRGLALCFIFPFVNRGTILHPLVSGAIHIFKKMRIGPLEIDGDYLGTSICSNLDSPPSYFQIRFPFLCCLSYSRPA